MMTNSSRTKAAPKPAANKSKSKPSSKTARSSKLKNEAKLSRIQQPAKHAAHLKIPLPAPDTVRQIADVFAALAQRFMK